jgi:hypothetical protein
MGARRPHPPVRRTVGLLFIGAALVPFGLACSSTAAPGPPATTPGTPLATLTVPPPATADPARVRALVDGLVGRLGLDPSETDCTRRAVAGSPVLVTPGTGADPSALFEAVLGAALSCGARGHLIDRVLAQATSEVHPTIQACLRQLLEQADAHDLAALLSGGHPEPLSSHMSACFPNT